MGIRTGSVNVGFDDGNAQSVFFAIPLGQFGRGRRLSLTVEANKKQGRSSGLKFRWRAKNTDQFGVEDVHGVRLHRQAGSWLFLSQARF